jgi:hypothetical protein
VGFLVPEGKTSRLNIATLDAVTGNVINLYNIKEVDLASESDLVIAGSHSAAPIAVWKERQKVRVNVLGYKAVETYSFASMVLSFFGYLPYISLHSPKCIP